MNNQLTFDELQAYQAGRLSGPARHRVERLLLEDPFYADALAGLEAMQQTATPTKEQLAKLSVALQQRIHASATQKRLWPLWIATTTAAILFMLAMAIYFIFFVPKQPLKPKSPVRTSAVSMVSARAFDGSFSPANSHLDKNRFDRKRPGAFVAVKHLQNKSVKSAQHSLHNLCFA